MRKCRRNRSVQIAGDGRRVGALPLQRTAVQPAGGKLHLRNGSILQNLNLLSASLPGEHTAVGLPVIENIVFPVDAFQAAVIVPVATDRNTSLLFRKEVTVADDHAAISISAVGAVADGVTQFMKIDRRVHQVIVSSDFTYGAGLKEFVSLKSRSLRLSEGRKHFSRFFLYVIISSESSMTTEAFGSFPISLGTLGPFPEYK